jgi:hypothetical protein
MGKQSSLGPIDPQLRGIPAQGVIDEFETALKDYKADHDSIVVWKEILAKYHPTFIGQCKNALIWTAEFVTDQLSNNMFAGDPSAKQLAASVVAKLSDRQETKTHERHIPAHMCASIGLKVKMLEDDDTLQDLALTVHHCYMNALANTGAFKVIENHQGVAFIKQQLQMAMPMQMPMMPSQFPGFPGLPGFPGGPGKPKP